jgi:hypothetical protein
MWQSHSSVFVSAIVAGLQHLSFKCHNNEGHASPLVLSKSIPGDHTFFDLQSTLPLSHITLLHGFIELDGCKDLLFRALDDVIGATVRSESNISLRFTAESIQIFELRSSATLIYCPDLNLEENRWLRDLYGGLRLLFKQCHGQESRFIKGWSPHLSLGSFGSASQARDAAIMYSEALKNSLTFNAHGLATFKRSTDGKFHANQEVPLVNAPPNLVHCNGKTFLASNGRPWSTSFKDTAGPVLIELERTFREIVGQSIQSRLVLYGSYTLGSAMHGISDVDAVIDLVSNDSILLKSADLTIFHTLSMYLQLHFSHSKVRFREAGPRKIQVTTVKLWPSTPAIDIIVCAAGISHRQLTKQALTHTKQSWVRAHCYNVSEPPTVLFLGTRFASSCCGPTVDKYTAVEGMLYGWQRLWRRMLVGHSLRPRPLHCSSTKLHSKQLKCRSISLWTTGRLRETHC